MTETAVKREWRNIEGLAALVEDQIEKKNAALKIAHQALTQVWIDHEHTDKCLIETAMVAIIEAKVKP